MPKITDLLQKGVNQVYARLPQPKPSDAKLEAAKLIAHRGAPYNRGHLENTIECFDICLNQKVYGIEFDIRFSRDNVPMVHHDESAKRVFGNSLLIEKTSFQEIRKTLPQIPTLDEVVKRYGKRSHLMIEVKELPTQEQKTVLQDSLQDLAPIQNYHLMSLKMKILDALDFLNPKAKVSIGQLDLKQIVEQSIERQIGAVTGQYLLFSNKLRDKCKTNGLLVGTGFSDSKYLIYREINRDIDWIFSNKTTSVKT